MDDLRAALPAASTGSAVMIRRRPQARQGSDLASTPDEEIHKVMLLAPLSAATPMAVMSRIVAIRSIIRLKPKI
jgi:hypothetical protein